MKVNLLIDNMQTHMSCVMRKPDFSMCNKTRVQNSSCAMAQADLPCLDSKILLVSKTPASFCSCAGWFVSYMVGNPIDRFLTTHLISYIKGHYQKQVSSIPVE